MIKTPTLKQKVKQYEQFLHNINMLIMCCNNEGIKKLLKNADNWSYSHRVGDGSLTEKQQQEIINKAFYKLNNIE